MGTTPLLPFNLVPFTPSLSQFLSHPSLLLHLQPPCSNFPRSIPAINGMRSGITSHICIKGRVTIAKLQDYVAQVHHSALTSLVIVSLNSRSSRRRHKSGIPR